ncbi:MAG: hypothetical protein HYS17_09895 [Micavibrio aeruginosavorus]|uniref:Uncharacterized protein n=1 Tax=Micavibrio aeruginosavorus TaxID=349221 RepID=A0A7T5R1K4_9BACT|nr:MAG: hypothetical protein HYS17_09895 [Micavibrio aeruginosavorus]
MDKKFTDEVGAAAEPPPALPAIKRGVGRQAIDLFVRHPYLSLTLAMMEIQLGFLSAFDLLGQADFTKHGELKAWGLAIMSWLVAVCLLLLAVQGLRQKK